MNVSNSTGRFEVSESGVLAADGFINVLSDSSTPPEESRDQEEVFTLSADDFYKELRIRGYEYGPHFCSVQAAMIKGMCLFQKIRLKRKFKYIQLSYNMYSLLVARPLLS